MKFSIIHASYGRPELAFETFRKWVNSHTQSSIEYILSIEWDDPQLGEYTKNFEQAKEFDINFIVGLNRTNTSVAAINNAAKQCTGDIIMVISDDFEPIPNWDLEILKVVEGKEDWILKTQDGTQPWIITLPIMDRKFYERFGYVYYPEYEHMYVDTDLTAVADYTGRKLTSNLLFRHRHYSEKDGIKKDDTSQKADRTWDQGEKLFLKRYAENFGIENHIRSPKVEETIKWIHNRKK